MSGTMNGHSMSIGYGEAGTVSDTLAIGRNYCHRHLGRIPTLTREQMVRLGCIFPSHTRPREVNKQCRVVVPLTSAERARIVELFRDGRSVKAISVAVKRSKPAVSRVLTLAGLDPTANSAVFNSMRPRIVALINEGADLRDIATITGAALSYVRTTASNLKRAAKQEAAAWAQPASSSSCARMHSLDTRSATTAERTAARRSDGSNATNRRWTTRPVVARQMGSFGACARGWLMADELFPAEAVASESPRLRWIKVHGVVTFCSLPSTDDEEWFAGLSQWLDGYNPEIASNYGDAGWLIGCEGPRNGSTRMGCGTTEADAIADLALKNGLRLWNECEVSQ